MKDIDIRQELRNNYLSVFDFDQSLKLVEELEVCQGDAKIDIAAINGSLFGFEIKSERDNLKRLPLQINYYNKVFDYLNIVTSENHLQGVLKLIPKFWGVMVVKKIEDEIKIVTMKRPQKNLNTDSFSVAQLLWKEEALNILSKFELDKGLRSKSRKYLWQALSTEIDKDILSYEIREKLKTRINWK